jgi:hypothetical protein
MAVTRFACLTVLALAACAPAPLENAPAAGGYSGTVQKVFRVVRRGAELPGLRFLGKVESVLGPMLRQNEETHQYVVRTPSGQIMAQSDQEFPVGACVRVIPQADKPGPAFRYGEASVVRCN